MKAYWVSGGTAPYIDLSTSWRCGQFHVPATLPQGKDPLVPLG